MAVCRNLLEVGWNDYLCQVFRFWDNTIFWKFSVLFRLWNISAEITKTKTTQVFVEFYSHHTRDLHKKDLSTVRHVCITGSFGILKSWLRLLLKFLLFELYGWFTTFLCPCYTSILHIISDTFRNKSYFNTPYLNQFMSWCHGHHMHTPQRDPASHKT